MCSEYCGGCSEFLGCAVYCMVCVYCGVCYILYIIYMYIMLGVLCIEGCAVFCRGFCVLKGVLFIVWVLCIAGITHNKCVDMC